MQRFQRATLDTIRNGDTVLFVAPDGYAGDALRHMTGRATVRAMCDGVILASRNADTNGQPFWTPLDNVYLF